ncbi:hypothetical protein LCGC14_1686820 [marine sediment metagenome]|uniref:Phosphoribosyltransferase domain-containing protein n=1 Tax=marine sediment metagenome TaxID=412755 RepID=A0A0F9KM17_9ZZZZ
MVMPAADIPELSTIIVPRERIGQRVIELAGEITQAMGPRELTIVCVLDGAIVFVAGLMRHLRIPVQVQTVMASSYRGQATQPAKLELRLGPAADLNGQDVLIVDDIQDTGATLQGVAERIRSLSPAGCKTCVLLRKDPPHAASAGRIEPDFVGFDIPDVFVVGYGLDFDGLYRNLPDIVVLARHQGAGS